MFIFVRLVRQSYYGVNLKHEAWSDTENIDDDDKTVFLWLDCYDMTALSVLVTASLFSLVCVVVVVRVSRLKTNKCKKFMRITHVVVDNYNNSGTVPVFKS